MTTTPPVTTTGCSGGCGKKVESPTAAGWDFLQITGRYRCGACGLALASVESVVLNDPTADPLPPTSIGALKKLPEPLPLHEKVRP